jgi:hypothetical protein
VPIAGGENDVTFVHHMTEYEKVKAQ